MSETHENHQTGGNGSAIVILILSIAILLATVPAAFLLVWMRAVNPESFRRNVCQETNLPTAESSPDRQKHHKSLFWRAKAAVSKIRGVAVAAGGAIALRSREAFEKIRRRASGLSDGHRRRYSDLPIMRQKSWQILAESHSEDSFTSSKDVEDHQESVKGPKKSTKTVRFDIGDEVDKEVSVQKPQPAVIAGSKT